MPIYEYRCADCRRKVSVFFRSFAAVGEPVCPQCGGTKLTRLMSRVVVQRGTSRGGGGDEMSAGDDPGAMFDGLDENDPRAMARAMRRMSDEMGEQMEPEMEEALGRLEQGEDPDAVMAGMEEGIGGGMDDMPDDEF